MAKKCPFTPELDRQLKHFCKYKPTSQDAAVLLGLDTAEQVEKYVRRKYGMAWGLFRDKYMAETRFMIINQILKQCKKGNTALLIFASKNLCGWVDRIITPQEAKEIILNYKVEEDGEVRRVGQNRQSQRRAVSVE